MEASHDGATGEVDAQALLLHDGRTLLSTTTITHTHTTQASNHISNSPTTSTYLSTRTHLS